MSNTSPLFPKSKLLNIRGSLFSLDKPKVMGILNITPDSFYDGGKYISEKEQLLQTEKMLEQGAAFIDIGAQSSKPGAKEIEATQELKILIKSIDNIHKEFPEAILSIDTWHSEIAKAAYEHGADIINDISGGTFDTNMFTIMAQIQIPYIVMHTNAKPAIMQNKPKYKNVTKEVIYFMSKQREILNSMGVNDVIFDPGFGFGKTIDHNYELINNLVSFQFLESPILVGISRKSMLYKPLNTTPEQALNSTTAINMVALQNGADILRVHDVAEAVECVSLHQLLKQNKA